MNKRASVILQEAQNIFKQINDLEADYQEKNKGNIYNGKMALLLNKLKRYDKELTALSRPGTLTKWNGTYLEYPTGKEIAFSVLYPKEYSHVDVALIIRHITKGTVKQLFSERDIVLGEFIYHKNLE